MKDLLEVEQICAEVAVPVPVPGVFSYSIPNEWIDKARIGVRVLVRFRNREMVGYLVGKGEPPQGTKVKAIVKVLDEEPVLSANMLQLTKQISEYYGSVWGETIENALPKWVKYGKKAERALLKEKESDDSMRADEHKWTLTPDQETAFNHIQKALEEPRPKPTLLFGVTGSGKSEIYIRTIRKVISSDKSAICLVPEIALTEQLRRFFMHQFGGELEILHSKLTDSERFLAWKRIESGRKRVVLGPRSAVFAPVCSLGLVIIDEEHESSYKQETTPRYHAREVARWRTENEGAFLLMGTATPSLETMQKTFKGEYDRIDLNSRIDDRPLPEVQVVDLKEAPRARGKSVILSQRLFRDIEANLEKNEGTMLLLNRRGFSTNINCPRCGHIESCDSCQVSLTFHQEDESLLCHYCNFHKSVPETCSECGDKVLRFAGFGTERVESEIARHFPQAKIARMDTDSVRKRGSHEAILSGFRNREIDILIGTQMIAKGFDFPHVTLVGVIQADIGLMLPDFRSSEKTFQLLTQVAGRAGRGEKIGKVVIQTYSPSHPSVRFAKDHDYRSFYDHEISERFLYRYPPSFQMMNIIIRGRDEKKSYLFARSAREAMNEALRETKEALGEDLEILGPAPLPFYKLRGHFRWHVMIKSIGANSLSETVVMALSKLKKPSGVAFVVDVDPLNIL